VSLRRREFITLVGGTAVAWPLAARGQQSERMRRVGLLVGYSEGDTEGQASVAALRQRLRELGWIEGRNIQIELRWAAADPDKARNFAKELVGMAPDVIVSSSNLVTEIVQQETHTVPVVFVFVGDPVGSGFVKNVARPGGNLTGFPIFETAIAGKWVEIFNEVAPHVARVAFMIHPETHAHVEFLRAAEAAALPLKIKLSALSVHNSAEIERGVSEFARAPDGGLIVTPHAITVEHRNIILGLAVRYRLPALYPLRNFATNGGLISYGTNPIDPFRQGASYVDRILKGEKPGDLPVQFPTKYELVVNLKTAKALGLTVPPSLLSRADEVIE
jgi:putative tryptophan/tyrosine transport system substrate-binding protein